MKNVSSDSEPRDVIVRGVPIDLCQLIKFAGITESGGGANQLIVGGEVLLNGQVEMLKRRKIYAGDKVTVLGQTIIVKLA